VAKADTRRARIQIEGKPERVEDGFRRVPLATFADGFFVFAHSSLQFKQVQLNAA
jgi:hypothetical protein